MKIEVTHVSRLDYDGDVVESVMDLRLGPLDDADQDVPEFNLRVQPDGHIRRYSDGLGNVAHLLTSTQPHRYLELTMRCCVETLLEDPFAAPTRAPAPLTPIELVDALDPSPLVPDCPALSTLAEPFRGLDPFEAARKMSSMIYDQFAYRQGVTDVTTTVEQILEHRAGVCQDFAHLLIGLCRVLRIPARYVSGYVASTGDRHRGAGASHAWVEAYTPTHGWRGFDPTNNLVANTRYVKIARGRDYADVPPTRGTFRGAANESLQVSVTARAV
ncbi:MAG: transglutaminase family protein [Chloroflexi bacterium]|nr:transglutaminase family protein [Chloroflexota bacterium]MBV9545569.1 transglutaminase family protein [Chloroflexota bacterium]